ncbi:MAG: hypothetical protein ABFD83_07725 [Armatimonadota bacterium]
MSAQWMPRCPAGLPVFAQLENALSKQDRNLLSLNVSEISKKLKRPPLFLNLALLQEK